MRYLYNAFIHDAARPGSQLPRQGVLIGIFDVHAHRDAAGQACELDRYFMQQVDQV